MTSNEAKIMTELAIEEFKQVAGGPELENDPKRLIQSLVGTVQLLTDPETDNDPKR